MQIILHLNKNSQLLEINQDLSFEEYRDILPKHIQINGEFNLCKLDKILSSIDSSILSFGRIRVTEESLEDIH
jgi:hypothetical protein